MWFILALCAVLAWSGSDLFSKIGSKPDDKQSHWKMVVAVGAVMGIHALYTILTSGENYQFESFLKYLPVSALYILSMIFGYAGLRYIALSISSPICNSSGALVSLLCFVFLKQSMAAWQIVAVIAICAGVFLLALVEKRQDN
ncbi:MAG: EamA family transporter, partial [Clostridia bacterium]